MTWTYTPGSTADRDRVRLLVGDTNVDAPENQRLADEELDDLITVAGGFRAAAPMAADALAAKFATLVTAKRMGQASLEWKRFDQLVSLAKSLRMSASRAAVPFAGGISRSVRDNLAQDSDRITPSFQRGMLDNSSSLNTTSTAAA